MQYFKPKTYENLPEALNAIYKELKRLQPLDSDTVTHSQSDEGVVSHAKTLGGRRSGAFIDDTLVDTSTEYVYQFQVIDASITSSDGTVTLRIKVQNGHNPKSDTAGYLNDDAYPAAIITLAAGTSPYYVYALNGVIHALNHEFQSDFFPVLKLAKVTISGNKLNIVQESFADNPVVPVCGSVYGAITLTGTVDVTGHVATASYKVAAKAMLNNIELPCPATNLELTGEGHKYLLAYVDKIIAETDTAPVKGFEFSSSGSPSEDREWYEIMFEYSLTANSFHVYYRAPSVHLFTFTTLYLNHNEASDD